MSVVVGISRTNPHLHAFSSVNSPDSALVLQDWHWETLRRAKKTINVLQWPCGDHGYEAIDEYELKADKGKIHAWKLKYKCMKNGKKGGLIKKGLLSSSRNSS